jgi:hypothetical protein
MVELQPTRREQHEAAEHTAAAAAEAHKREAIEAQQASERATHCMRGLDALDQAIRLSVLKSGPPGAGIHLLLSELATSTLGVPRQGFPIGEPPASEAPAAPKSEAHEGHRSEHKK